MKILKESIEYEVALPSEDEVAEFITCHLPSEECIKNKIFEINPGFDYKESIYFKIKDKIEALIRSILKEFSCDEADAVSYVDVVFNDIKSHAFSDPELEGIYDIKEPVEVADLAEEAEHPKHLRDVLKGIDAIYIYNDARQAHLKEGLTESEEEEDLSFDEELLSWPDSKLLEHSNAEGHPLEEAVQVQYFRITYKHETGIYATDVVEAPTYDEAVKIFNERGKGELISCDSISKDEYEEIIKSLGVGSLTEDLNVNVDTEEQNINVAAEENAAVEVKVAPKDCAGAECDAEAELAELAKDPKYAKAFAYLMSTLQGEPSEIIPSEEADTEEAAPLTESVEEEENTKPEESTDGVVEDAAEDAPKNPQGLYTANQLNELIKGELDAINLYNDFLLTLRSMTEESPSKEDLSPEFVDSTEKVIKDILVEENLHVGQLQELLKQISPNAENIEAGAEEAKEQIEGESEELEESVKDAGHILRDNYKDPEAKALIDAIISILEEHSPDQADKVREVLSEVENNG